MMGEEFVGADCAWAALVLKYVFVYGESRAFVRVVCTASAGWNWATKKLNKFTDRDRLYGFWPSDSSPLPESAGVNPPCAKPLSSVLFAAY